MKDVDRNTAGRGNHALIGRVSLFVKFDSNQLRDFPPVRARFKADSRPFRVAGMAAASARRSRRRGGPGVAAAAARGRNRLQRGTGGRVSASGCARPGSVSGPGRRAPGIGSGTAAASAPRGVGIGTETGAERRAAGVRRHRRAVTAPGGARPESHTHVSVDSDSGNLAGISFH
jgi:hypothetical protein